MKNKKILVLSLLVLSALVACGGETTSSSNETSTGSENSSVNDPSSESSSVQRVNPLEEALKKDYSNVTVLSYQQYNDGDTSETDYQYYADGYIANYSYDLALNGYNNEDCYSFYAIDENGESWNYFEAKLFFFSIDCFSHIFYKFTTTCHI